MDPINCYFMLLVLPIFFSLVLPRSQSIFKEADSNGLEPEQPNPKHEAEAFTAYLY